jgi:hypothetical protein
MGGFDELKKLFVPTGQLPSGQQVGQPNYNYQEPVLNTDNVSSDDGYNRDDRGEPIDRRTQNVGLRDRDDYQQQASDRMREWENQLNQVTAQGLQQIKESRMAELTREALGRESERLKSLPFRDPTQVIRQAAVNQQQQMQQALVSGRQAGEALLGGAKNINDSYQGSKVQEVYDSYKEVRSLPGKALLGGGKSLVDKSDKFFQEIQAKDEARRKTTENLEELKRIAEETERKGEDGTYETIQKIYEKENLVDTKEEFITEVQETFKPLADNINETIQKEYDEMAKDGTVTQAEADALNEKAQRWMGDAWEAHTGLKTEEYKKSFEQAGKTDILKDPIYEKILEKKEYEARVKGVEELKSIPSSNIFGKSLGIDTAEKQLGIERAVNVLEPYVVPTSTLDAAGKLAVLGAGAAFAGTAISGGVAAVTLAGGKAAALTTTASGLAVGPAVYTGVITGAAVAKSIDYLSPEFKFKGIPSTTFKVGNKWAGDTTYKSPSSLTGKTYKVKEGTLWREDVLWGTKVKEGALTGLAVGAAIGTLASNVAIKNVVTKSVTHSPKIRVTTGAKVKVYQQGKGYSWLKSVKAKISGTPSVGSTTRLKRSATYAKLLMPAKAKTAAAIKTPGAWRIDKTGAYKLVKVKDTKFLAGGKVESVYGGKQFYFFGQKVGGPVFQGKILDWTVKGRGFTKALEVTEKSTKGNKIQYDITKAKIGSNTITKLTPEFTKYGKGFGLSAKSQYYKMGGNLIATGKDKFLVDTTFLKVTSAGKPINQWVRTGVGVEKLATVGKFQTKLPSTFVSRKGLTFKFGTQRTWGSKSIWETKGFAVKGTSKRVVDSIFNLQSKSYRLGKESYRIARSSNLLKDAVNTKKVRDTYATVRLSQLQGLNKRGQIAVSIPKSVPLISKSTPIFDFTRSTSTTTGGYIPTVTAQGVTASYASLVGPVSISGGAYLPGLATTSIGASALLFSPTFDTQLKSGEITKFNLGDKTAQQYDPLISTKFKVDSKSDLRRSQQTQPIEVIIPIKPSPVPRPIQRTRGPFRPTRPGLPFVPFPFPTPKPRRTTRYKRRPTPVGKARPIFGVAVRKAGKWTVLPGKALMRGRALKRGARVTRSTIAASFTLVPTGKTRRGKDIAFTPNTKFFREPKGKDKKSKFGTLIFVQKQHKSKGLIRSPVLFGRKLRSQTYMTGIGGRLSTRGEQRDILRLKRSKQSKSSLIFGGLK